MIQGPNVSNDTNHINIRMIRTAKGFVQCMNVSVEIDMVCDVEQTIQLHGELIIYDT